MSNCRLILIGLTATVALAGPLAAQEAHHPHGAVDYGGEYAGEWRGAWESEDTYRGNWEGTYQEGMSPHNSAHHADGWDYGANARPLAYSPEQREQWLADCRALYLERDPGYAVERDEDGKIIGGLLGAVAGGFAGNRIAGRGNRVVGTVIGAGLGGLAGAAIGDAIDGDDEPAYLYDGYYEHPAAAGYCEAYLRHYEATGYFAGSGTMQVVTMVQAAPQMQRVVKRKCAQVCGGALKEEWIDEPAPTARRVIPRKSAPAPVATKLQPVKAAPVKTTPLQPVKSKAPRYKYSK